RDGWPALRGAAEADRGLRPGRVLRLPSRRAPRDPTWLCPLPRGFLGRGRTADQATAVRADGLPATALPSAAADRGDLHARSDERRAFSVRCRPRHFTARGWVLRGRLRARHGAVRGGAR